MIICNYMTYTVCICVALAMYTHAVSVTLHCRHWEDTHFSVSHHGSRRRSQSMSVHFTGERISFVHTSGTVWSEMTWSSGLCDRLLSLASLHKMYLKSHDQDTYEHVTLLHRFTCSFRRFWFWHVLTSRKNLMNFRGRVWCETCRIRLIPHWLRQCKMLFQTLHWSALTTFKIIQTC